MVNLELRQIKYFIEVAKKEHVTEAADKLHVAQSAVSRQIANLEAELGVQLFIRQGRNVKLTAIGEIFLQHMEQALHVIEHAKQVIEEYMDPERGIIRLGFTSSMAAYILPNVISAFCEEYPKVQFKLSQGSHYALQERLASGEINMALLGPVPTKSSSVQGTILFHENMIALLPESHPLANEKSIQLDQLRSEKFILFPEGFVLRDIVIQACRQLGFNPDISFEGEELEAIKGLVSAGLGVSLVPEITLVDGQIRSAATVPVKEPEVRRTVGMIIPVDRQLLPTEKLFFDFLKEFFKRLKRYQY